MAGFPRRCRQLKPYIPSINPHRRERKRKREREDSRVPLRGGLISRSAVSPASLRNDTKYRTNDKKEKTRSSCHREITAGGTATTYTEPFLLRALLGEDLSTENASAYTHRSFSSAFKGCRNCESGSL